MIEAPLGTGLVFGLRASSAKFAAELALSALPDLRSVDWPDKLPKAHVVTICKYDVYRHVGYNARGPKAVAGTEGDVRIKLNTGAIRFRQTGAVKAAYEIAVPDVSKHLLSSKEGMIAILEAVADLPNRVAGDEDIRLHEQRVLECGRLVASVLAADERACRPGSNPVFSPPSSLTTAHVMFTGGTIHRTPSARTHPDVQGFISERLSDRMAEICGPTATCQMNGTKSRTMLLGITCGYQVPRSVDPVDAMRHLRTLGPGPHFGWPGE